eukprot:TRINITY_DN3689_c0_g1_i1.p1 TRINITY_DN3689_c0_g1~~TRINITY_DN3689_c0_g1_i1.p1  ORF type:complete len:752 (+),score=197.91 TRINITY_DN3689_c0_g1_i1:49-2304(+)
MSEKRGLDAELERKAAEKRDPKHEKAARDWIEQVAEVKLDADLFMALKSGVVLCQMIEHIVPGIVGKYTLRPKHYLEEKDNVKKYLAAAVKYGVPGHDLFEELDLSESRKNLDGVITHIYALSRQAQAHGWNGPILGPKYYKSVADQKRIVEKREIEKQEILAARAEYDAGRRQRVKELEEQQQDNDRRQAVLTREKSVRRQVKRSKRNHHLLPFAENRTYEKPETTHKFGLDAEHRDDKYGEDIESAVLDWLEIMSGEQLDFFWACLKSGRILCNVINKIVPGKIPRVSDPKGIAAKEREYITFFLNACREFGVDDSELFDVNDLHKNINMSYVIRCILALSRVLSKNKKYAHIPTIKEIIDPRSRISKQKLDIEEEKIEPSDEATDDEADKVEEVIEPDVPLDAEIPEYVETDTGYKPVPAEESRELLRAPRQAQPLSAPKPWQCWKSTVFRGFYALIFNIFILFFIAGGNFGDVWIRESLIKNTPIFVSSCTNATTTMTKDMMFLDTRDDCRLKLIDEMFMVNSSVVMFAFAIAGIIFDFVNIKLCCIFGLLIKIGGCVLLALSSNGLLESTATMNYTYIGYILFNSASPFVLFSTYHVFTSISKPRLSLATFLASVYFSGGGWVTLALTELSEIFSFSIVMYGYCGVLGFLGCIAALLLPWKKGAVKSKNYYQPVPTIDETDPQPSSLRSSDRVVKAYPDEDDEPFFTGFKNKLSAHYLFIAIFVPIMITSGRLYSLNHRIIESLNR